MAERKILNTWKEVANYLGKGVRTVQRYERELQLPVRRATGKDRSAVVAFADELDDWMERTLQRSQAYVRPILVVVDRPYPDNISSRKLSLELAKFNVLTAFTTDEAFATAERVEVDGFVVDCDLPGDNFNSVCERLRQRHPNKPIFAVGQTDTRSTKGADYLIRGHDPQALLEKVVNVFGTPRLA